MQRAGEPICMTSMTALQGFGGRTFRPYRVKYPNNRGVTKKNPHLLYPVRNNAPLLPPGQRPSWAGGCGVVIPFRIIPAGFNAPPVESLWVERLEFLTGFTKGRRGKSEK